MSNGFLLSLLEISHFLYITIEEITIAKTEITAAATTIMIELVLTASNVDALYFVKTK